MNDIDRIIFSTILILAAIAIMCFAWMAGPLAIATLGCLIMISGMSLDN